MVLIMSITLDARAVYTTLLIGYLIALAVTMAYWHGSMKFETIKVYAGAKSLQVVGLFLLSMRDSIPSVLSVLIANCILCIVYTLEICVLFNLQHMLTARMKWLYRSIALGGVTGFLLIYAFSDGDEWQTAFSCIMTAITFIPAYRVVAARSATMLARVMGTLYLLVCVWLIVRAGGAALGQAWASFYKPSEYQLPSLLFLFLMIVMGHIGIVLLVKEQLQRELVELANQDDLTGALNRRAFTILAERQLKLCARTRKPISYLLFDVDRFKIINDTYGHYVGDQVLRHLATRIRRHLGTEDMFVRYGGDEFGILLPGVGEEASTRFVEQMVGDLEQASDQQVKVPLVPYSISVGLLTIHPDAHTQMDSLYMTCDHALYAAKRDGRNRVIRVQADQMGASLDTIHWERPGRSGGESSA